MPKKATPKNIPRVIRDFADFVEELDKVDRKMVADTMNEFFDELLNEDFFGTEGQCDPRGDHRG